MTPAKLVPASARGRHSGGLGGIYFIATEDFLGGASVQYLIAAGRR